MTGRHESDIDAGQKQRQTNKGIEKTDADFLELNLVKALKDQLKYRTECNDRQQGGNDLTYVVRQRMDKFRCDLAGVLELRNCDLRITSVAARIKNAEQQDRKHGADAAQCD